MVQKETRFALNAPGVIFDEIDGEVLVIDLKIGHYFRLREGASRLWNLIISGRTFLEITYIPLFIKYRTLGFSIILSTWFSLASITP